MSHVPAAFANIPDRQRRLHIGYLSSHSADPVLGGFIHPLREGHRSDEFAISHYDTTGQTADTLAAQIQRENIDILVNVSGALPGIHHEVLALHPAPLQLDWLGTHLTAQPGSPNCDYLITHADLDPVTQESSGIQPWRLPGSPWLYQPASNLPEVSAAPWRSRGFVTFGVLAAPHTLTPAQITVWAYILNHVTDSHLILHLPEGDIRQQVATLFAQQGVAPERLHAFNELSLDTFRALHDQVDILLDSFPHNYGLLSCESLWRGVPLVSCYGTIFNSSTDVPENLHNTFVSQRSSRITRTLLAQAQLASLATTDLAEHAGIAIRLAQHPAELQAMRHGLRSTLAMSALCSKNRFIREMESTYRCLWWSWCARQAA